MTILYVTDRGQCIWFTITYGAGMQYNGSVTLQEETTFVSRYTFSILGHQTSHGQFSRTFPVGSKITPYIRMQGWYRST